MPQHSLDNFLDQLVHWTRQIIESGRTPFRKVEINPPLIVPPCQPVPHLTLWINRDSHMAGGLILLPEKGIETTLETGTALASALGLHSFATWDRQKLITWSLDKDALRPRTTTAVGKIQSAGDFRQTLRDLLDQLKVLAIAEAPQAEELSPYWVANLVHLSLIDAGPEIAEQLRATRTLQGHDWDGGRHPELAKGLLTVCRLLAVGHADLLARTLQAEGLERALRFAIEQLPGNLQQTLRPGENEPALPDPASTRFHHLWRRLQQLGCLQQRSRLARAVELLLEDVARLGPSPPCPDRTSASASLVVNPTGSPGIVPVTAEIGITAVLGWRELLRWLQDYPSPVFSGQRMDQLPAELQPRIVSAALDPGPPPDKDERPGLSTALRLAWPSRRFQLPVNTPTWHYDLLQILGRAAPAAAIHLRLPATWLDPVEGEVLWELLCSDFRLSRFSLEEAGTTLLEMTKEHAETGETRLVNGAEEKTLVWAQLKRKSLQHLIYAITWPQELYRLIEENDLVLTDERPAPVELAREIYLYWNSGWGQQLARWCGFPPAELTLELLTDEHSALPAFPHPDKLQQLTNLLWTPGKRLPEGAEHDRDVALWVGRELANPDWPTLPEQQQSRTPKPSRSARRSLVERIESRLLVDGLPKFPEQYLYDHYRPELTSFSFSGPLRDHGRFFGQIELQSANQERLLVDSDALAGCLILASRQQQQIDLPQDQAILADILTRYLDDLKRLYHALVHETHRLQENKSDAQRLAKRLWKRWNLPEWDAVEQVMTLFSSGNSVE